MTIQSFTSLKPQWLHLVWATEDQRPWIPVGKERLLAQRVKQACRQQGIYLDVVNAHHDHLHLLARPHRPEGLEELRSLLTHACRRFIYHHLAQGSRENLRFQDWAQGIRGQDLGRVRRHLLRQEQVHQQFSLEKELRELGLIEANQGCVVLGDIEGRPLLR